MVKSEDTSTLYMTLLIPVALSFNVAKALAVNHCTKIGSSLIAGKIQSFSLTLTRFGPLGLFTMNPF